MRSLLLALSLLACTHIHALTGDEIQSFIDQAIKAGGGEIVVPPGTHVLTRALQLKGAAKTRLIGLDAETCVLKLAPVVYAESAAETLAGADRIAISRQRGIAPGIKLRLPETDQSIQVKSIEDNALILTAPLKSTLLEKSLLVSEVLPDIIEISGNSEGLTIEKLTLDGGRLNEDPTLQRNSGLSGIVATSGSKHIFISRCIFQNFHGSGMALPGADECLVQDSTFMDITAQAIDLGIAAKKCTIQHNHITRSGAAIQFNEATDTTISGNEIRQCAAAISISGGPNTISNNVISGGR